MISNLKDILLPAKDQGYAVACFNVFGFEDSRAVIDAAESRNASVILSINLDMRQFMTMDQIIGMLKPMAISAKVPVCIHLDHTYEVDVVKQAIDCGFTSVMFDGSQLPISENIAYAASAIMSAAASSATEVDLAAEAAIITKQMMLQKISTSLVAQANFSENAKLSLLS